MPNIRPFKGVVYNQAMVGDISKVIAPPYDIIPPKLQDELYRKHANNFVRLELNKITKNDTPADNRYTRADKLYRAWLDSDILVTDYNDAIYIYSETHKDGAKTVERVGFLSLLELDMSGKKILPHENTLAAPKQDRLELMRAMKANLSPIFVLYDDPRDKALKVMKDAMKHKPFIDAKFDGVRHKVWRLTDERGIKTIQGVLRDKNIFIADGHHRYEVARMFCKEVARSGLPKELKANARYMMAYFVSSDEKMLSVLPTHRMVLDMNSLDADSVVKLAGNFFEVEKASSLKALEARLSKLSKDCAFGMYMGGKYFILKLKDRKYADIAIKDKSKEWKSLDVAILHHFLLRHILKVQDTDDNIEYTKDAAQAKEAVSKKKAAAAFILNPTKVSQIKAVARLGECMPKKATYFYPKPASGLVMNRLDQ